ncbi:hypothetical protein EXIGLDRAFT_171877 [Exidia glandulosa HHB12029]|uniref:Uncharacterized protein n=1 Tax=Exidia glandulosa HHB12029 TaxID=1314781 RepID=A0A165FAN3_EXIGL|nr:hypothetical protein EXIGLDRAFT_171877 [Exidia glandulosa HHB12029]
MRHPVLLRGGASLMRGQEAGINGEGAPSHTARKYGLTGLTDEFMAYTVTQCRYAVSDEPQFTYDGTCGFDYRVLYHTILGELQKCRRAGANGPGASAVEDLVQHWNECMFTTRFARGRNVEDDDEVLEHAEAYCDELARRYGEEADHNERSHRVTLGRCTRTFRLGTALSALLLIYFRYYGLSALAARDVLILAATGAPLGPGLRTQCCTTSFGIGLITYKGCFLVSRFPR